jgi:hypothetical protein
MPLPKGRPSPLPGRPKYDRYGYRSRALLWAVEHDHGHPPCPLAALYLDMRKQLSSLFFAEYFSYAQEKKPEEAFRQRLDADVGELLLVPKLRRKLQRGLRAQRREGD